MAYKQKRRSNDWASASSMDDSKSVKDTLPLFPFPRKSPSCPPSGPSWTMMGSNSDCDAGVVGYPEAYQYHHHPHHSPACDGASYRASCKSSKRYVSIQSKLFKVPDSFFQQMPSDVRDTIKYSSGYGLSSKQPIILHGHTEEQFRQLMEAYKSRATLNPQTLSIDHLLTIGELSFLYRIKPLQAWFLPAFEKLVHSRPSPLRTAPNAIYVRSLRLVLQHRLSPALSNALQTKWICRMLWGELSPRTALIFADFYGIQYLLGHACYLYLLAVEPRIRKGEGITARGGGVDERGMLSPSQGLYVMSGFHFLKTYWKQLARTPLEFAKPGEDPAGSTASLGHSQGPGGPCHCHAQCVDAWRTRWVEVARMDCPLSELDVLNRLIFMEQNLSEDAALKTAMTPSCHRAALRAIALKREKISHDLHHIFDL